MNEDILNLLRRKSYAPMNIPELLRALLLEPGQQQALQAALRKLVRKGAIARIKGNRYIIPVEADLIPGRMQVTRGGNGYLHPDDPKLEEIPVSATAMSTAMHDDRVLVRRDTRMRHRGGQSTQAVSGSVVRVLERARTQIVGALKRGPRFLYVIPDDPRMQHDVYVPEPNDVGTIPREGDKVVVELREWESRHTNPEGEVIEVLGPPDKEGVDLLRILRGYGLPLRFPRNVLREARAIGTKVAEADMEGRVDCRSHQVITIDPEDARDFDDAFCIQRHKAGHWRLWVHIADVSHYVKPGSELDKEARRRGNSTYLVDRVIPMLPEALSNELCSLKPQVDRLSKCVEFAISDQGEVLRSKCYAAVIHSQRRFSYEEAFKVLQGEPRDEIERMLHDANRLAQRIRKLRFRNGSLNLDFPETKIRLKDNGEIDRIEKVENDISHQLIEEFMLLANEAVAETLIKKRQPSIHRVHEQPDERRLAEYREEILSHDIPCGNLSNTKEVQKLLNRLDKLSIGPALKIGFLKSLMRARYAVEPLGHYGLAKQKYAHFTSPIRRYADLIVHRSLFENGRQSQGSLRETADHISRTERNSDDAERDSKSVKLFAYLERQIASGSPAVYSALVTDLRNFGFFVDVQDLGMSGLVPLSHLDDDFYVFDAYARKVTGRRHRRTIRLGDRVDVQVLKVDTVKKRVDFQLANTTQSSERRRRKPNRGNPAAQGRSHSTRKRSRQRPEKPIAPQEPPGKRPKKNNQEKGAPAQSAQSRRNTRSRPRRRK